MKQPPTKSLRTGLAIETHSGEYRTDRRGRGFENRVPVIESLKEEFRMSLKKGLKGVVCPHRSETEGTYTLKRVEFLKICLTTVKLSTTPNPISKRFRMSDITKYDKIRDSNEYILEFATIVKENDLTKDEIESILVKKFGEILSGGTLMWYSSLLEISIDAFIIVADSFAKAHVGVRKVMGRMTDIFKTNQCMEIKFEINEELILALSVHHKIELKSARLELSIHG
ncbi:hypothetical protein HAX54_033521 [Datura stramonium]|uniref:Uncharacterized protein n=1 Tax=Datura stramonium TaxID=4076 RepID=A0ABS8RN86_DATST|nr:hypothetical protein [Datura stramonium]